MWKCTNGREHIRIATLLRILLFIRVDNLKNDEGVSAMCSGKGQSHVHTLYFTDSCFSAPESCSVFSDRLKFVQ